MTTYTITTDAFSVEVEAADIDSAVREAFAGEGLGKIETLEDVERRFAKIADGAECTILEDGVEVAHIGPCV